MPVSSADQRHLPSATGGIARLACARAKEGGIELESLLRKAGLTRGQIDDPDARLKVRDQIRLLDVAAEELADDFLGFHLAQTYDLRAMGLLYYVAASSHMLVEALQRVTRYSMIANEGVVVKFREAKDIAITFNYVGVARHSDRHQIEFWMATVVRICRQLTGRRLPANRVRFTHQRHGDTPELNAFFGSEVEFGAMTDEIAFDPPIKELAVIGADPYLNELLTGYCEEALARRGTNRGPFGLSVENAIALLLPHGKAQAGEVAHQLGVSRRTLARRLAAEGLTFAGVLQNLRSDLAQRHLNDETLPISKIAWLLGYRDVSAFTHAFRRWTGKTPGAARHA